MTPHRANWFTHTGNACGYECQWRYFWRLVDVADGYGRCNHGKEIAHGRVVTVRVDGMTFLRPVAVGDVVCCYARCVKRGTTSVSINIEVWVKKVSSEPIGQRYKATEALFIYVAVDSDGKPASFHGADPPGKASLRRLLFIPSVPRRSGGRQCSQSTHCRVYRLHSATCAWPI